MSLDKLIHYKKQVFPPDTPILIRSKGGWNLHGVLRELTIEGETVQFKGLSLFLPEIEHIEIDGCESVNVETEEITDTAWYNIVYLAIGVAVGVLIFLTVWSLAL